MEPRGVMSTLARPARSEAPDRLAAHKSITISILIGMLFLYTYTEMRTYVTRRRLVSASALASAALSLEAAPPADVPPSTAAPMPAILGGPKAHPPPPPPRPGFAPPAERSL